MKKKLRLLTLGCSKNTVDSEHLLACLADAYDIVQSSECDVCLINTCGFIADAKEESVTAIMDAVLGKQQGQIGRIAVFGCLSQRYMSVLKEEIPEVDAWFGARELDPVLKWLGINASADNSTERYLTEAGFPYAYLKISEGCDRRCSYCAIPFIRGAHRSVPVERLVQEAEKLSAKGVRELEIIAQDTTYYGLDLYGRRALGELLEKLSSVEGIDWLRIHYSYPASFPEDVLVQMANNPKVCKYLDIPLQHISDSVLSRMHRGVDGKWTRELISRLRSEVPDVVLRTTLIVGFPGETEDDFNELLEFVRWAKFERLGAFMYSEEEGTYGALHFKDDVPQEVKQRRSDELMRVQQEISEAYNTSMIGKVVDVLVDDVVDGNLVCRSQASSPEVDGEIIISAKNGKIYDSTSRGKIISARIVAADTYDLEAEEA